MNTLPSRLVTEPRRLRLFVSSTFTDMKEERQLLEREVFPKIRRLCQERAVEFYAVNLVWGISSDVRLGDAIDICLREVRNCHPFFLGWLGQRYGRVQDLQDEKTAAKINALLEKQRDLEWLRGHLPASVTELEIQQLLRLEVQKEKTQFYCREEAYLETLRESERFQEKDGQREDLFAETAPLAREKLRQLKQQLVEAQLPLHSYATPQQGAQFALERLTAVVKAFFPADELGGRNTYPDFRLVQVAEGYKVKGLAYPGREVNYDGNSQVPSGSYNGRTIFYVFGRYPATPDGDSYPVLDMVIGHGDFLNLEHNYPKSFLSTHRLLRQLERK